MPHSDDSNQELAPVMHFQQALSLSSSSLSLGIVGPGYSSGGYIFGCSQRLALRLGRSARIGYVCSNTMQCFCFLDFHQISWSDDHNTMHNVC